jgi:hypothetical protein
MQVRSHHRPLHEWFNDYRYIYEPLAKTPATLRLTACLAWRFVS